MVHKEPARINMCSFISKSDLDDFKQGLEAASHCRFVTRSSDCNYSLLKCNMDRDYHGAKKEPIDLVDMDREPKMNTLKLNANCSAFLSIKKEKNGTYNVRYSNFHPHQTNQSFTVVCHEIKNEIKILIDIGIPDQRILRDLRKAYPDTLITLQDIANVRSNHCTNVVEFSKNDKVSCQLYAQNYPDKIKLIECTDEKIVIIIQTQFQKDLLSQSNEDSVFGLDSTHCTTRYGFFLSNLHIIMRPNTPGIPVAHMVSSDEKGDTVKQFLNFLKPQIANFKTTMVSDDYSPYRNEWKNAFGDFNHIQCLWHLEKNFRINLTKNKITGNYII